MFRFDTLRLSAKVTTAITAVLTASVSIQAPANALPIAGRASIANRLPITRHLARPLVSATASVVYVADEANNVVWVFNTPVVPPATSPGGATAPLNVRPLRSIQTGNIPTGLSVDSSGNLYVAEFFDNVVQEYAPGSSTPFRTLTAGLNGPTDVKVSLSGAVYVTNFFGGLNSGNESSVVVYGSNSTAPAATWLSPIANAALTAIALQSPDYAPGGDAYVAYSSLGSSASGILWCPVGSATCFDTGITTSAQALAFQYGTFPLTLLASDPTNNLIDVYHLRHGKTPAATFSVPGPAALAFDPSYTNLFVASNPPNRSVSVNEYTYPSGTLNTIFTPGSTPKFPHLTGVAVYPSATY
jgi:hypothetical protein